MLITRPGAQVGKLLFSLNIDPMQLPSGPAATQDWDRLYAQGVPLMQHQACSVHIDCKCRPLHAECQELTI